MRTDVKILLVALAIGALVVSCTRDDDDAATVTVTDAGKVTVAAAPTSASTVAIDTQAFKANIEIPGIEFDGSEMDLDGVKLPEGSAIKGLQVNATDKAGQERGSLTFDFASPMPPASVADHLATQIDDSDWGPVTRSTTPDGAILLSAVNTDDGKKSIAYRLIADGTAATRGTATIRGDRQGEDKQGW